MASDTTQIPPYEANGLPVNALVLTPSGFVEIGTLKIGDQISDPYNEDSVVTGVFPQGVRPVYEILFHDGSSVISDEEHRWKLHIGHDRKSALQVVNTKYIFENFQTPDLRFFLPKIDPIQFSLKENTPLHAYLLGAILGDGCINDGGYCKFSNVDKEMVDKVAKCLPEGCQKMLSF
jgi:ATP-dependent DNA helicase RecG